MTTDEKVFNVCAEKHNEDFIDLVNPAWKQPELSKPEYY